MTAVSNPLLTEGGDARVALVTGAARGIGLECCAQLARSGWRVLLSARTLERAAEAVASFGAHPGAERLVPIALDVIDERSVATCARDVELRVGRLDLLINNAAAFANWEETASHADLQGARATMEANLFGPWQVTSALLPLMRRTATVEAPAHVVMVASGSGSHGDPRFGLPSNPVMTSYAVSKAALLALTTKFAVELRGAHVLVYAVDPGLTATAPGMEAMGARPVAEGARSVLWGIRSEAELTSGGFYRDGEPMPW